MTAALFGFFAAITVGFAGVVAFSRSIFRAAFALMGTLIGVAGITALLGAVTVAALHVMIYVGGIFVLFLFAILVTENPEGSVFRRRPSTRVLAGLLALMIGAVLAHAAMRLGPAGGAAAAGAFEVSARTIGRIFLADGLLLFEAVSVLLLAGLVAAVVVMRKELVK